MAVLAYGALAGGFLTDRWLDKPEPRPQDLDNRSLVKYHLIIQVKKKKEGRSMFQNTYVYHDRDMSVPPHHPCRSWGPWFARPVKIVVALMMMMMWLWLLLVQEWDSWSLFQELLRALRSVADRHHACSIAMVAIRYVLDLPGVTAVILGQSGPPSGLNFIS
jgi:hypothetical protein